MVTKLAKLIDVKTIVTLSLTVVCCCTSLKGVKMTEQFYSIYTMVLGYFFGYQLNKKNKEE